MNNTIRVLVVADATPMRQEVIDSIEHEAEVELVGTAASPSQALTAVRDTQPDIILLDELLGDTNTLSLTEDLVSRYPDLTVIAMTREGHMDYVRQAMLAGARGFVTTPLADGELSNVVHQMHRLEMARRTKPAPEAPEEQRVAQGTVIAIYSPKGGVGKTTLAANLGIALAKETGERVALVDSNPQFGHLGLVLNVHANYSLADLMSHSDDLDPELIEGMMASHSSGVKVLLAPREIERADAFPPQSMSALLSELQRMFDWIVVDTWTLLTESTLDVLETADRVLVPVIPDITCLRDTRQFLDLIGSLNYPLNKFDFVINRATEGGLDRDAIVDGLGREVMLEIPQDDPLVTHSLNRGVPLITSHKRSPVSKAVKYLAKQIATADEEPAGQRGFRGRLKRLFGAVG